MCRALILFRTFSDPLNILDHGTRIDRQVGFTVRQIHLKKSFIYKYKISRLPALLNHMSFNYQYKNGVHGINFYVQSRVNLFDNLKLACK